MSSMRSFRPGKGKCGKGCVQGWWSQDDWYGAGWQWDGGGFWPHWQGFKSHKHYKGGKYGKYGKGGDHGNGSKGWNATCNDVASYTEGVLVAEGSLGWGVSGACFRGSYQTERGSASVAIKPARNWCETAILSRLRQSDPPLPCVVPVLLVQHPTPGGDVNVTALGSHGTLGSLLNASRDLHAPPFLALIASIADGLAALHSANVIHCDLKPDNVVLHVSEAGEVCLWLIDFGDARLLDEPSSWHTQGWGAPEIHCQPDSQSGQYSSRTDSWCLAQCAALMWAGSRDCLRNPAWLYDDMPLCEELQKCLSWDAAARSDAAEIARAARAALQARGTDIQSELKQFLKLLSNQA